MSKNQKTMASGVWNEELKKESKLGMFFVMLWFVAMGIAVLGFMFSPSKPTKQETLEERILEESERRDIEKHKTNVGPDSY